MKTKWMLLAAAFAVTAITSAQTDFVTPDYAKIKSNISDRKTDNYFPKLMERYVSRDTTMTDENFRNLYFGFMMQSQYNPYGRSEKIEELRKYADLDKLDKKDLKKAIDLMDKIFKEQPFDLNVMNMQAYAYQLDGNREMSKKVAGTLGKIIDAILQSGDGKACETAFHVQSIQHEYMIMSLFNLEAESQSLIGHCDYLQLEKDKYKIAGLYFDISKMQESMMASFGK